MKNKYEKEYFTEVVTNSINYTDVCKNLGIGVTNGNRNTVKKYIKEYCICINHFYVPHGAPKIKKELSEILIENSNYTYTSILKERLYKEGLKQRCCEICGQGEEWKGKHMSLILDHINGKNNDNRIENLRIVCANCNATLDTHGGKNRNVFKLDIERQQKVLDNKLLIEEEKKLNNGKTNKEVLASFNQRKIERPSVNILIEDVKELGYSGTGRKYGVSDNAIRKWIK